MSPLQPSEAQKQAIEFALSIAADKFQENAKFCRETGAPSAYTGLATQFDNQATEARALLGLLQSADVLTLSTNPPRCARCDSDMLSTYGDDIGTDDDDTDDDDTEDDETGDGAIWNLQILRRSIRVSQSAMRGRGLTGVNHST